MVFRKKFRPDVNSRFKKGLAHPNKGKTFSKGTVTEPKPFVRLAKSRHDLVIEKAANAPVRFLRPKVAERPEVEKSADCDPDTRYATYFIYFLYFFSYLFFIV